MEKLRVDTNKCVGCGNCVLVCTMGVISVRNGRAYVNEDECVECGTCRRFLRVEGLSPTIVRLARSVASTLHLNYDAPVDVCPTGALYQPELEWPRTVRQAFSDPTVKHPTTGIGGRGTEEIKTNDVTGRLGPGDAGLIVEMGRPGMGTRCTDLQKMSMALARVGAQFEPKNPVTSLMTDASTGQINPDVLNEKVMSAIIEMKVPIERIPEFLGVIREVAGQVDTVFSVAVAGRCDPEGRIPYEDAVREAGWNLSLNAKTNLGLGRRNDGGSSK